MDVEYLYNKIKEELHGSKEYIKTALELRPMTEAWAKKFYSMSMEEHTHATNFYNMFNEYCTKMAGSMTELPDYIKEMRKDIVDIYTECTATIKSMWELYK